MFLTETATTMSSFVTELGTVATAVWSQVTKAAETITSTPLLLFTVGILLVGAAVGILGRLISRG